MLKKTVILVVTIGFFALFINGGFISSARTQASKPNLTCGSSDVPFYDSDSLILEEKDYTVYGKLGKSGETTAASLYQQDQIGAACSVVGENITLNDKEWKRIGSLNLKSAGTSPRLQLSSEDFDDLPDVNRPSLLLVSKKNPVCKPVKDCLVTVDGIQGRLIPNGTLLNEDTLHVVKATDPKSEQVTRVDYFVDATFAYTTSTLQDFDIRFVPSGEHALTRAVKYASGQQVVLESSFKKGYRSDISDSLYRLYASNSLWLKVLFSVIFLLALLAVILLVIRLIHKRKIWRISHGFEKENIDPAVSTEQHHILKEESSFSIYSKNILYGSLIGLLILVVLITINTYVFQFFRVEGISMETSLQTGNQLLVNKLGKTASLISSSEHVPKRGEVVVFRKKISSFLTAKEFNEDEFVVKRVIGLPGERIRIEQGIITVFSRSFPDGFNPDKNSHWENNLTLDITENIDLQLSQSEIFVAGDNRPESIDSRANGAVHIDEIVGRAVIRVSPLSKINLF